LVRVILCQGRHLPECSPGEAGRQLVEKLAGLAEQYCGRGKPTMVASALLWERDKENICREILHGWHARTTEELAREFSLATSSCLA